MGCNPSREVSVGSGLAIAGGVLTADATPSSAAPGADGDAPAAPKTGEAALRRLRDGNQRFVVGKSKNHRRDTTRRAELAQGQAPFAIVLGCSDSRVAPEIVFDEGLGDLFLVRVAGNTAADPIVMGSIEYAATKLGSILLVVLGHDDCGAVKAALDVVTNGTNLPGHLGSVTQPIIPAVQAVRSEPADAILNAAISLNVRQAVGDLRASPLLSDLVTKEQLTIVGAQYRLHTGRVELINT